MKENLSMPVVQPEMEYVLQSYSADKQLIDSIELEQPKMGMIGSLSKLPTSFSFIPKVMRELNLQKAELLVYKIRWKQGVSFWFEPAVGATKDASCIKELQFIQPKLEYRNDGFIVHCRLWLSFVAGF